jgi:hypothetical protein
VNKLLHKSTITRSKKEKEESPYKPDTVKGWIFERKITFARYFCPFLFTSKCQFNEL